MKQHSYSLAIMTTVGGGLGGLIGACVGIWWLAVILTTLGALAMYLVYEWRSTIRAVKQAWNIFFVAEDARTRLSIIGYGLLACLWLTLIDAFIIGVTIYGWKYLAVKIMGGICLAFGGVITLLFLLFTFVSAMQKREHPDTLQKTMASVRTLAIECSPPLLFYCATKAFVCYVWRVFLIIHSKQRTICGASVFVGALAGFILRTQTSVTSVAPITAVLTGAVCGLAFGLVSHNLIAKRWLIPRGHLPLES